MSGRRTKIPWRVWCRVHAKAIAQALPFSFLLVAESRDMYYRSTWHVQTVPPESFHVGDVIAISNRWYTLQTWNHVLYSFLSKVLLKSSWDDLAVVTSFSVSNAGDSIRNQSRNTEERSENNGSPTILFCDFTGLHEISLDEFIKMRRPRGLAVRHLQLSPFDEKIDSSSSAPDLRTERLECRMVSRFKDEVAKLPVHPWYLFRASMRLGNENKYYEFCVAMHEQRVKINNSIKRGQSHHAISAQQKKLLDMEIMRVQLEKFTQEERNFFLFNGSLIASFFATFGLLDRVQPPPSRYVPQDFAHSIPFIGTTELSEPIVFFRS